MTRVFGTGKPKTVAPNLNDCIANVDSRVESVEKKAQHIDEKLKRLTSKMSDGPSQNNIKQKALRLLRQKKHYESQADKLWDKSFNLAVNSAIQTLEETALNVKKSEVKAMKKEFKKVSIDQVEGDSEDLQDELANVEEDFNEFQTDDSGAGRQFWANLLINWHTKKERILRRMKPTKRSNWISQGDGLHNRSICLLYCFVFIF